jgi:hypothetical protein
MGRPLRKLGPAFPMSGVRHSVAGARGPRPGISGTAMRHRLHPPGFILPAQPVQQDKPPAGAGWVHEIKHDGYRMLVRRDGETVRLWTRNAIDYTDRLTGIAAAADPVEWMILKDRILAVYSRYGLMPDLGTVDLWRIQHDVDCGLIWLLISHKLEERLRLDPRASLQYFTPMVTREAVRRNSPGPAAATTSQGKATSGPGNVAISQPGAPRCHRRNRACRIAISRLGRGSWPPRTSTSYDAQLVRAAIDGFAAEPNGGLIIVQVAPGPKVRKLINELAAQHRLPTIYGNTSLAEEGGLLSYGSDARKRLPPLCIRDPHPHCGVIWLLRHCASELTSSRQKRICWQPLWRRRPCPFLADGHERSYRLF